MENNSISAFPNLKKHGRVRKRIVGNRLGLDEEKNWLTNLEPQFFWSTMTTFDDYHDYYHGIMCEVEFLLNGSITGIANTIKQFYHLYWLEWVFFLMELILFFHWLFSVSLIKLLRSGYTHSFCEHDITRFNKK